MTQHNHRNDNGLSRRDFLKMSAIMGAGAYTFGGVSDLLQTAPLTTQGKTAALAEAARQVRTVCAPNCSNSCGILAHVKDGKIAKVEPGSFPDPTYNRICLKGISNAMQRVYSPDRVKYPMKRVGERGEGKFERISWDQAYTEIGAKLNELKSKYGPESCAWTSLTGNYGLLASMSPTRIANLFGGTILQAQGLQSDHACSLAWQACTGIPVGSHEWQDLKGAKLIVMFGCNYAETALNNTRFLFDAMDEGARLVVIDPRFSRTAAKADWWIPIRPGTDGALVLAMMHVIIKDKLIDEAYLRDHTQAPALVRADTGALVRESDITGVKPTPAAAAGGPGGPGAGGPPAGGPPGGGPGGPGAGAPPDPLMVWDAAKQQPVPLGSTAQPPILGTFQVTIGGKQIECHTAFQALVTMVQDMTPEKAADICDIPAADIQKLAREYATTQPAALRASEGVNRYYNSHLTYRAMLTLAAITGNIGKAHAGFSQTGALLLKLIFAIPMDFMFPEGKMGRMMPGTRLYEAIPSGKPYPIKAIWFSSYGFGTQAPNQNKLIKDVYPNLELIVVSEQVMTAQTAYADYVLPVTSYYEEEIDLVAEPSYYLQLRQRAIEPLWEAKSDYEIFGELAKRMGLSQPWPPAPQAVEQLIRNTPDPIVKQVSFEELKQKGVIWVNYPNTTVLFADQKFGTPSGRFEFYFDNLVSFQEVLPVYKEPLESNRQPAASKYPLTMLSCHQVYSTHSQHTTLPWILEVNPEPRLDISMVDAQKRGIANGDWVEVFNDRGSAQLRARVTAGIKPGTINIYQGFWPRQFRQGAVASLTHMTLNPAMDAMGESNYSPYDTAVEVKRL